jgi:hypothetical protein
MEWIEQLPAALEDLRCFTVPVIDRATLERLLKIERRTAGRLMRQFGGYQVGRTFLIDRRLLIHKLEQFGCGEVGRAELRQSSDAPERTCQLLPGRNGYQDTAAEMCERLLRDLRAAIPRKPGELRVEFFGPEDLLRPLFELSQAIMNNLAKFRGTGREYD